MNAKFPDDKTIREVLTLATRAPSVHNSQPWRWHVGERSLDLRCVPALHLRATDPDRRDLILTVGQLCITVSLRWPHWAGTLRCTDFPIRWMPITLRRSKSSAKDAVNST